MTVPEKRAMRQDLADLALWLLGGTALVCALLNWLMPWWAGAAAAVIGVALWAGLSFLCCIIHTSGEDEPDA